MRHGGQCYALFGQSRPFYEAQYACQKLRASLARVLTRDENLSVHGGHWILIEMAEF